MTHTEMRLPHTAPTPEMNAVDYPGLIPSRWWHRHIEKGNHPFHKCSEGGDPDRHDACYAKCMRQSTRCIKAFRTLLGTPRQR